MDDRIGKWLYDVKAAIGEIRAFRQDTAPGYAAYRANRMLKRAVERELEIIGEAVNRIVKHDSSYLDRIHDARNIIGLRNQVIHAYDSISDENIYAIIVNHLPRLEEDVDRLLEEHEG